MNSVSGDLIKIFRTKVTPRQHSFNVTVPRWFCFEDSKPPEQSHVLQRKLYFNTLRVIPDYFDIKATLLKMDPVEEFTADGSYHIGLHINLQDIAITDLKQRPKIIRSHVEKDPMAKLLAEVNMIGLDFKKDYMTYQPFFVDWKPRMKSGTTMTEAQFKDFLKKMNANPKRPETGIDWYDSSIYQRNWINVPLMNSPPAEHTHIPVFDSHLKTYSFEEVNPFSYPTDAYRENTTIRLHIAPYTMLAASNPMVFQTLGFEIESQFKLHSDKLYAFDNSRNPHWIHLDAHFAPFPHATYLKDYSAFNVISTLEQNKYTKIHLHTFDAIESVKCTQADLALKEVLNRFVSTAVKKIAKTFNIEVSYDETTQSFSFPQVPSSNLQTFKIILPPPVGILLGYGNVPYVDKSSKKVAMRNDVSLEVQAYILAMDTGMIYVTGEYSGTSLVVGTQQSFLGELRPSSDGTLSLVNSDRYIEKLRDFLRVPECRSGSDEITIEFNLTTFDKEGKTQPLIWPCNATIFGGLRSRLE
jgi:hypothetical protein